MASPSPKDPLIMIIGPTGTGKSKLAVELATRFNGEVINCDAMQMYKGLPIITNKIPEHERNGVPHHLLDFIDLRQKPWSVQQFVKQSSCIFDEIKARGKLPIVVGGTIYYTFSLLFKDALLDMSGGESSSSHDQPSDGDEVFPILSASTEEIYAKLQEVDPEMAKRWHPRDRQKIQRSLRIFLKSGKRASDVYAEQRQASHNDVVEGVDNVRSPAHDDMVGEHRMPLRYPSLLLWLEAEDIVLKSRLNDRVDAMVVDGLCHEVVQMANLEQQLKGEGHSIDMQTGIWASIGYKEMKPWLEVHQAAVADNSNVEAVKLECLEAVKASTRRYAKSQNRFVRIRLAKALNAAGELDRLFLLDCTDLRLWKETVGEPARALADSFLRGDRLPKAKSLSAAAGMAMSQIERDTASTVREARTCEVCQKILMTEKEWTGHLASRSHKKIVAWRRRQEESSSSQRGTLEPAQLSVAPV